MYLFPFDAGEHFRFYMQVVGLVICLRLNSVGLDRFVPVIPNYIFWWLLHFCTCSGLLSEAGYVGTASVKLACQLTSIMVALNITVGVHDLTA